MLATTAALLSKETAIVAPAAILLIAYLARAAHPEEFSWRPYVVAMALVLIPLVAYLLFRAPSIANTIGGNATQTYTPALAHVPANALRFFAYPFRLQLVEMSEASLPFAVATGSGVADSSVARRRRLLAVRNRVCAELISPAISCL